MPTFKRFEDLDNENFFVEFISEYFVSGWPRIVALSGAKVILEPELVKLAYNTYMVNLQQYTVALRSRNPDHYKRAGALLNALYKTRPIVRLEWESGLERMRDFDNVGVSYGDAQHWDDHISWFDEYANFGAAFDISFRRCDAYETAKNSYDKDFLDSVCFYMKENNAISVGSFMMIFKAFMA